MTKAPRHVPALVPVSDPVLERLAALETRVAALERRQEVDDRELLRTIATAIGAATFTARDLRAHVRVDHTLALVLATMTTRELGARLRRLRDRPFSGLVLRLIKRTHGERVWSVAVIDNRHANARVLSA